MNSHRVVLAVSISVLAASASLCINHLDSVLEISPLNFIFQYEKWTNETKNVSEEISLTKRDFRFSKKKMWISTVTQLRQKEKY